MGVLMVAGFNVMWGIGCLMGVCFVDLLDSVGLLIVLFVVWVGWGFLVCWFVVVQVRLVGCVRAFDGGFCGFACML